MMAMVDKDGTPVKERKPNAYAVFVKENFASVKAQSSTGTPHKDVMKHIAAKWAEKKKASQTPVARFNSAGGSIGGSIDKGGFASSSVAIDDMSDAISAIMIE